MKTHVVLLLFCAATLGAIVAATTIHRHQPGTAAASSPNQNFDVKGQVRSLETDGKTIHIAHEDIPGFMPAMEMPFTVKDPTLLLGLAPGDPVKFHLVVTRDDSWITRIEKLPAPTSGSAPPASRPPAAAADSPAPLQIGDQVPDFALIDQHGRAIHLRDFRGKAVVLTFIYTRCPLPNYCPLMSKNFASLQERFEKESPGKVQLLSISFDPEFDTPQTLDRYAALYQHDDKDWLFACGTPQQVDRVTGLFGLYREPANGFINHDLRTALISPAGKLVHVWRSNVWTPYEVQRMVRETLQPALVLAN